MELSSTRFFLVLAMQLASLVGAIYFIMWTPVYDVVVWDKQVLQSLKDGYHNVVYAVVSLAIFVYSTFYLKRLLAKLEPQARPLKTRSTTSPAKPQTRLVSRAAETKGVRLPRVKCPQCGATVYENIPACPFCGWARS